MLSLSFHNFIAFRPKGLHFCSIHLFTLILIPFVPILFAKLGLTLVVILSIIGFAILLTIFVIILFSIVLLKIFVVIALLRHFLIAFSLHLLSLPAYPPSFLLVFLPYFVIIFIAPIITFVEKSL